MQSVDVQNYQCILHKYIIQTVDVQNYQCILHKYIMQTVDVQNITNIHFSQQESSKINQ
jgi:uncharacterized protein (UPF0179 family)